MRKLYSLGSLVLFISFSTLNAQDVKVPVDTTIVTTHSATIKGKNIPYTATTGFQPVWDEQGKPVATLNYTFYQRSDIKNKENRPLVISFNGGPGSASVWMHIAYTGPRVLKIDDEGFPVQPYGMKDNPNSILDMADVVYVNPVNTGYSRMLPNKDGDMPDKKMFFGVNADIEYLAGWIRTFVTRYNRWLSPKFLMNAITFSSFLEGLGTAFRSAKCFQMAFGSSCLISSFIFFILCKFRLCDGLIER